MILLAEDKNDHSNIKQQYLSLEDCDPTQINNFHPTVLMSQRVEENATVLQLAITHWAGYGLYYPNFVELDLKLLQQDFPKVILLEKNSTQIESFAQHGQVVFTLNQYQHEVRELVYFGAF